MKAFWGMLLGLVFCSSAMALPLTDWKDIRYFGNTYYLQPDASNINPLAGDRNFMHWDISGATDSNYCLSLTFTDIDPGDPQGILQFYYWYGDGVVSIDEYDNGVLFTELTGLDFGIQTAEIDVTALILAGMSSGENYFSIALRAGNSDRYGVGPRRGLPDPILEVCEAPQQTVTPIPTPIVLLGTGLIGLVGFRRR